MGSGTAATGGVFYDLVNVEYQAFAENLEPNTTHYIYLFEHRPPEGFEVPNDWSAWGGVETGAFDGEDDKFFFLGEFETNHRGIGALSVSMGAESAAMMRRFNMIAIYDHPPPPGRIAGRDAAGLQRLVLRCRDRLSTGNHGIAEPDLVGGEFSSTPHGVPTDERAPAIPSWGAERGK